MVPNLDETVKKIDNIFSDYQLISVAHDIKEVTKNARMVYFTKICIHNLLAAGLMYFEYFYIAPIFIWFGTSSIIKN